MNPDDYQIDVDALSLDEEGIDFQDSYEEAEQRQAYQQQQELQLQNEEAQAKAELDDPREIEGGGGLKGIVKEVQSAIGGGLQDTASSVVTLPERAIDMFSGEMQEEQATDEGYGAEWDDWFVDDANPIETKTWWGGALRSLVHFGSLAAAIIPAAKVAGVTAASTALGSLVRGAAIGATSDVISKYSQEDNGLEILRDRYNFIDTPLSTKDVDHPAMKTLKNVVEGMGIGVIFDAASMLIGKGVKKIRKGKGGKEIIEDGASVEVQKAVKREIDVDSQIKERGINDLSKPEYTAYKNSEISDPWQGAPTSNGKVSDVRDQLNRIGKESGAELGSTDSLTSAARLPSYTTPIETELVVRSSEMAEDHVVEILGEFMTDARLQGEIQAAKKQGKTLAEIWGDSAELIKEVYEGRNTSDLTPEEFWARMFEAPTIIKEGTPDEIRIWDPEKASASRLIIGSLMRELRDAGIGARELADIADLGDIDGPAKAIYEKIIAGLTQIKLSSMKTSGQLRAFGAGKQSLKQLNQAVDKQVAESIDAFKLAFKVAGDSANDDLFKAYMEIISMSNDIRTVKDFDNWVRKKLKGGDFNGEAKTGVLIKELEGMMINSVLSGPKTSVRAIMGTGTATFLRPISQVLGATLTGDVTTRKASISALTGMIETIPEAWTLFKTKLNSYWSGDIATVQSRFSEYTKGDEQWAIFSDWIENSGKATLGDKAAFYMANMARALNDNKFLTYSTKIMAATDDTFGYILARAKGKEKAMRAAIDAVSRGDVVEITPQLLKNYEDRFLSTVLDQDGNIIDAATLYAKKEATLTTDLTGFSKGLNEVFDKAPWAKPFFLFARTGVNGLALTAKHTPGFNFLVKEYNEIATATVDNLADVKKYGITTVEELANAKALQTGRLAIGGGIITMASMHFMNGGLTGNGPADRQQRRAWIDGGYKPRTITIGGVQVSYDSFEPFNLILSTIADIGDYSQLMGEEWTEDNLQKLALVVAQGITSKSYLAGLQQFVDLFGGTPGQAERIIGSLMNNIIPMSSARNELGKLFNPHMKELNSGIWQSIRNRNLITEGLAVKELPTKYDLLNGKPIRDWDFPTRMFNMFSPVQINLDQSPGRKLLFESKYDMRMSTLSSPDGLSLKNNARLRSLFQKAIGDQNLERKLNKLARNPKIINSINQMQADLNAGIREMDPRSAYMHNQLIHELFTNARKKAWATLIKDPEVLELIEEQRRLEAQNYRSLLKTSRYEEILNV